MRRKARKSFLRFLLNQAAIKAIDLAFALTFAEGLHCYAHRRTRSVAKHYVMSCSSQILFMLAQNFTDPNVLTTLLVGAILLLLLLLPTARQLGSRVKATTLVTEPAAGSSVAEE